MRVDLEDDPEDGGGGGGSSPSSPGRALVPLDDPSTPSALSSVNVTPKQGTSPATGNSSPTDSLGHCDEVPVELGDPTTRDDAKEAPWFPLEDYMPFVAFGDAGARRDLFGAPPDREGEVGGAWPTDRGLQEAISYFTAPAEAP